MKIPVVFMVGCLVLGAVAGCSSVRSFAKAVKPAEATVKAGASEVTQTGSAEQPAKAETTETQRVVPIPAGSEIVSDAARKVLTVKVSEPTEFREVVREEKATAPQSFKPPEPPSPSDIASGRATFFFQIGMVLGAAVGLFGMIRGWDFVMYGGAAVAAGCAIGVFMERYPWLFAVIGVGACLCVVGPLLWHLKLKKLPGS
jgi:hypothetical protein